jgi:proline iminopeptidase
VPTALASPPPETAPFATHALDVGEGHVLHVEEHGRPDGAPALVLHGGPGSGQTPLLRRGFDPNRWRIVCVDQRGAGRSRPHGAIAHNDTGRLLADLRRVRGLLAIDRWLVVGGSWGATLALLHAADQPEAVAGLLLRASFAARPQDIAGFLAPLGEAARLARAFARGTLAQQRDLARAWHEREQHLARPGRTVEPLTDDALDRQVARCRIQSHYLAHGCWLAAPTLLERCAQVPRVPTLMLHGRDDRVCPPDGVLALQARLPGSRLRWIDSAGHDPTHAGMQAAMATALDDWLRHRDFAGDAA